MSPATLNFKEPFPPQSPVQIHLLRDSQQVSKEKHNDNCLRTVTSLTRRRPLHPQLSEDVPLPNQRHENLKLGQANPPARSQSQGPEGQTPACSEGRCVLQQALKDTGSFQSPMGLGGGEAGGEPAIQNTLKHIRPMSPSPGPVRVPSRESWPNRLPEPHLHDICFHKAPASRR